VNLVPSAPAPHSFYLVLYSGGPPTIKGWASPTRARIKGLIPIRKEINPTRIPSPCHVNFKLKLI